VLFLVHRFLSPWWRRSQVPPKRRFLQEPHGVTTQKTPFFFKIHRIRLCCRPFNSTKNFFFQKGIPREQLGKLFRNEWKSRCGSCILRQRIQWKARVRLTVIDLRVGRMAFPLYTFKVLCHRNDTIPLQWVLGRFRILVEYALNISLCSFIFFRT
jgi:hypothetical protein